MISKEAFINTMKHLENLDTKMARVDSALKDLCKDFCGFYITDIFDIVINLLEEVFHDQEEWIGYFVFEEDWLHGFIM